jgi:hypothetical protein
MYKILVQGNRMFALFTLILKNVMNSINVNSKSKKGSSVTRTKLDEKPIGGK